MPVFDERPTVPFTDQNVALVLLVLSSLGIIDVFYAIRYVFPRSSGETGIFHGCLAVIPSWALSHSDESGHMMVHRLPFVFCPWSSTDNLGSRMGGLCLCKNIIHYTMYPLFHFKFDKLMRSPIVCSNLHFLKPSVHRLNNLETCTPKQYYTAGHRFCVNRHPNHQS